MPWYAHVGFEPARVLEVEAGIDALMTALPSVGGVEPSVSAPADGVGVWTVAFCVDADNLKGASSTAQAAFARTLHEALPGAKVRARWVEVLDEPEFDRRLAEPLVPELVGISEIAEQLGVSKSRARELVAGGRIRKVADLASGPVCLGQDLEAYAATPRRAGRPRKVPAQIPSSE